MSSQRLNQYQIMFTEPQNPRISQVGRIHKDHQLQLPVHQEASLPQYKAPQVHGACEGRKTTTQKGLKTEEEVLKGKE